jgi:hypothetical protein
LLSAKATSIELRVAAAFAPPLADLSGFRCGAGACFGAAGFGLAALGAGRAADDAGLGLGAAAGRAADWPADFGAFGGAAFRAEDLGAAGLIAAGLAADDLPGTGLLVTGLGDLPFDAAGAALAVGAGGFLEVEAGAFTGEDFGAPAGLFPVSRLVPGIADPQIEKLVPQPQDAVAFGFLT